MSGFATLWLGPLPGLIQACLASFPAQGRGADALRLRAGRGRPHGRDLARRARDLSRRHAGPALPRRRQTVAGPFRRSVPLRNADAQTELAWVDADMIALRFQRDAPLIWGRQPEAKGKALINNAVLRLPRDHPVLTDMLAHARAAEGREIGWGAIGPYPADGNRRGAWRRRERLAAGALLRRRPGRVLAPVRPRLARPRRRFGRRRRHAASLERAVASRRLRLRRRAAPRLLPARVVRRDRRARLVSGGSQRRPRVTAMIARWEASAPKETP